MKKLAVRVLPVLAIALVIAIGSGVASAQLLEVFSTNYYSNNTTTGAPAATLRFTEHGSVAPEECAMIYVYAADQQLTECCGCPVSYNGLVHENVKTDLLGNTLTKVTPNEGVIQIVSGEYLAGCDPAVVVPQPEIDSWTTHIQNKVGTGVTGSFPITETAGDEELLSEGELGTLESDCAAAIKLGSGAAVCTCNPEDGSKPKV